MHEPRQLQLSLADNRSLEGWEESLRLALDPLVSRSELESHMNGPTWVRLGIATNAGIPIDLLRRLSLDRAPVVRKRVARHPRVPLDVVRRLATDPEELVRTTAELALRKFPNAPP